MVDGRKGTCFERRLLISSLHVCLETTQRWTTRPLSFVDSTEPTLGPVEGPPPPSNRPQDRSCSEGVERKGPPMCLAFGVG